jgi:hypothetical protein
MRTIRRLKVLISVYGAVLLLLLICVCGTPLLIREGMAVSSGLQVEEEILETILIVVLFGISAALLRGLLGAMRAYRQAAERVASENTTLLARLAEAFRYIGTVNVEIQEIRSVLGGPACFPHSRREFRRCLNHLADKAMAISGFSWVVIRIIDRSSGRTVKECAAERRRGTRPPVTLGNRDILASRGSEELAVVVLAPQKLDLLAACILPHRPRSEPEQLLLTAILSQFVMLFLLQRAGCPPPAESSAAP